MGSIPATLDITFLRRRTVSSQFPQSKQRSRLHINKRFKKSVLISSEVTRKPGFHPATSSKGHTKPNIWLIRTPNGQRLSQKPYKTIQNSKTSFFFTFKNSTLEYFHHSNTISTGSSIYFWQTYVPYTQFLWPNLIPTHPQFLKSVDSSSPSSGNIDFKLGTALSQTLLTPQPCIQVSKTLTDNLPNNPLLPLQLNTVLSFYEARVLTYSQRCLFLRLNAFQKVLYSQTKYYKMLKNCIARFNITSRFIKKRFLVLFPYQLSPQILSGISTREQVPNFRDIDRSRSYFTPSFSKAPSLQGFLLSKKSKSLSRLYTHTIPLIGISQHMRSFTQGTLTQSVLSRSRLTKLVSRVFRQFMIKRLFRPTPTKTHLRSIRRIRRCWTKTHLSSLLPRLEKSRKLASDRKYEEALFKEMLSTPPGVEGPLLKTFLYTGFEAMPLMNQKLGNTLFRKNRRLRSSTLSYRVPNRGKRRHFVRTQLRLTTPWAQNADSLRPLIKNLRNNNGAVASLYRTSAGEKRRYRYTLRYWRKRTAYFSRRSLALTLLKRKYSRFKRKLKLRKKKNSRNSIIRKELRSLGYLNTSPKKQTRGKYKTRIRRRKKKKIKRI